MNEIMTLFFRFCVLVWKMRQRQTAYFREGKKQSDLVESKRLEGLVDRELKGFLKFENGEPAGLSIQTGRELLESADEEPTQERLL